MSSSQVWLIPVTPSPGLLLASREALGRLHLHHDSVRADDVRERLRGEVPVAAVIQADRLQPVVLDVQRWLGQQGVPTLVLLESVDDRREALLLERGAQDVVRVPTSLMRLRGRLLALSRSRRPEVEEQTPSQNHLIVPPALSIYPERRLVLVGDQHVDLTKTEFDLLLVLARAPADVLTRDELAAAVDQPHLSARAFESHLSRLRAKLRVAGEPPPIQAVRGLGYRLIRLDPAVRTDTSR